ncbi:MAG: hypothetical protein AAB538_01810 [Patescibacteria group bacterium]
MPSLIGLGYLTVDTEVRQQSQKECDCTEARRGCMPTFVFSVEGQVAFRSALDHIVHCRKTDCVKLRRLVLKGMRNKLFGLFTETVLLGCVHVQPHIYGARRMRLSKDNFSAVCHHLAHCPREACAKLRRSLLLAVRDVVSPNAQPRE